MTMKIRSNTEKTYRKLASALRSNQCHDGGRLPFDVLLNDAIDLARETLDSITAAKVARAVFVDRLVGPVLTHGIMHRRITERRPGFWRKELEYVKLLEQWSAPGEGDRF